jgi:4,5-DOPA dioxygenase extradiol
MAAAEVHVPGRRHPRALSIDYSQPPPFHYELARRLRTLRSKGVLIIGSGNVVHNLGERGGTGITESPREWAVEFDRRMAAAVTSGRHADAIEFLSLGSLAKQAHPTHDHFLPFLYALGLVNRAVRCRRSVRAFSGRASACARS